MKKVRKFKWWTSYLPHIIIEKPYEIKKEDLGNSILRADDQFFIENKVEVGKDILVEMAIGGFLFSFFIFFIAKDSLEIKIVFSSITFLIATFCIIYHYTYPKKLLILDRLNGLVTFPSFLYSKPYTMSFDDLVAGFGPSGIFGVSNLVFYHYNGISFTTISAGDYIPIRNWSFIVWYMDKNRPLPPGEAFDPYREKDFHRRKAEGFPPPLYKSNISTGDSIVFTEDFTKNKNSQENNAISKKNSIKKRKKK